MGGLPLRARSGVAVGVELQRWKRDNNPFRAGFGPGTNEASCESRRKAAGSTKNWMIVNPPRYMRVNSIILASAMIEIPNGGNRLLIFLEKSPRNDWTILLAG